MRSLLQVSIWRNNDIECTPSKGYKKMKIKIIALGKIKEKFLKDGIDEFMKRFTPYASVEIVELMQEGDKILSLIKNDSYVITLEIDGKQLSSEDFATKINEITINGTG